MRKKLPIPPDAGLEQALADLLAGARAALGSDLVGLYLYGSLASGDFNPARSDIDFAAATRDELLAGAVNRLEKLHARLADGSHWTRKLEGAYVPLGTLRRHDPSASPCPAVNERRFYLASLGSDWIIQRHILREQGVVLAGPPPRELIDAVSPDEIRSAVREFLREWWAPMLGNPHRLRSREYQAYAVLTLCRALYTLQSGEIISKPAAARWGMSALGEKWRGVIQAALDWPQKDQADRFGETLELLRYMLGLADEAA